MLIAVDTVCSLWVGLCDDCVILSTQPSVYLLSFLLQQLLLLLQEGCAML